jgi:tripartite-type tricarboxylate transporter receptor subunit TctC
MIENASNARRALWLAILVSIATIGGVSAQDYPTRPIRWIIGFPPGGPTDILVRLMGERLQARLGQPVLVENKPGAASNIATEAVVNAPPDGYTLGSVTSANAINATVNKRTLGFDYLKQLVPVAGMSQGPSVMVINPAVPAKNVAEFVAYAKANPGKLNMGTPGVGSTGHLAGELFKATAGVDLVHIPYRGAAPAMTDLIGGQVQVMFD